MPRFLQTADRRAALALLNISNTNPYPTPHKHHEKHYRVSIGTSVLCV